MKSDILKSHNKLREKGHVLPISELSKDELDGMKKIPGADYHMPWGIAFKEDSLSTPVRMVFNASARTPGGESLNSCLAKGQNTLGSIPNILLRFRRKPAAFSADVSMAYNGVKLRPEYYKYQLYLWKEDLEESNPVTVMVARTVIYVTKPAGNLTIAGFGCLCSL